VDRALNRMADLDPALYELLEMQAFAGLTIAEVAELRGVSSRTVNRDLIKARALLQVLLGEAG
jgi:DNA-directed RNA polymerase specialized sigma24 family protein